MKTKMVLLAVLCLVPIAAIASTVYAQQLPDGLWPLGTDPSRYVNNPAPAFPNNSSLSVSVLIPSERILSSRNLPTGARLISLNLMNWGEYSKQEGGGQFPLVADGRLVWVLKDEYPEYRHYRRGLFKNAKVTEVFDAQTGQLLNSKIVGFPENIRFPTQPRTPVQ
jgi:hypothetical protein